MILGQEPLYTDEDRWITFDCGNTISLYNKKYNQKMLQNTDMEYFNQAYIADFLKEDGEKKNNIIILNFEVEDLKSEYERIRSLQPGDISELRYVNVHMPYWYFNVKDPDRNILEITGDYN